MNCRSLRITAAAAIALLFAVTAQAAETNVAGGYAVHGYDPVAYFTLGKPTPGNDAFTAEHEGTKYRFASTEHRDTFLKAPDKYAPQYGGFCAFGTAKGRKFDVDPEAWYIEDGKLYLNYSKDVNKHFRTDVAGFISKADNNWRYIADLPDGTLKQSVPAGVTPVPNRPQ